MSCWRGLALICNNDGVVYITYGEHSDSIGPYLVFRILKSSIKICFKIWVKFFYKVNKDVFCLGITFLQNANLLHS